MQLVLTGTHEAKGAADDVGLLANAVQNIWDYVRLELRLQEDDALAEKPLFAFNFWSFAFMCEFCTILYLLANISHSHICRPRRSHDEHSEPKETNLTLV